MDLALGVIIKELIIYKYLFLFPVAVLEGPIVSIIAGFLVSTHNLNFYIVYLVLFLADLIGDILHYALGYFGRKHFVDRFGKYVGLNPARLEYLETLLHQNTGRVLIGSKFTQVVGGGVLVAAGMVHVNFFKYMFYSVVVAIPKTLMLLVIGFYFGVAYNTIDRYFNFAAKITVGVVLVILGYLIYKQLKKRRAAKPIA